VCVFAHFSILTKSHSLFRFFHEQALAPSGFRVSSLPSFWQKRLIGGASISTTSLNTRSIFIMKFSAALSLAIAPLALAKAVHNVYPLRRDSKDSKDHSKAGGGIIAAAAKAASTTEVIIIWANPGNGAATTTINQVQTVTQTVTAGAAGATIGSQSIAAGATTVAVGTGATHTVSLSAPA
jgi:hypothetical protein